MCLIRNLDGFDLTVLKLGSMDFPKVPFWAVWYQLDSFETENQFSESPKGDSFETEIDGFPQLPFREV